MPMQVTICTIGNSKGVVLPDPLLAQAGLSEDTSAHLAVENGAIVLRKVKRQVRQGWIEQAKAVAALEEDALLMGEFSNAIDDELVW